MLNKSAFLLLSLIVIGVVTSALAANSAEKDEEAGTEEAASSQEAGVESNDTNNAGSDQASVESDTEKNAEQLATVLAIKADAEYGAYLGGECSTCHTPDGGDGSIPVIHAKSKHFLASALLEYKNQQRTNEVMRGVTTALGDEEIAALATYFSEQ